MPRGLKAKQITLSQIRIMWTPPDGGLNFDLYRVNLVEIAKENRGKKTTVDLKKSGFVTRLTFVATTADLLYNKA